MKDEITSVPMTEHVGLIAKMYSLTIRPSEKRTAKGVSKSVIRSKFRHLSYKRQMSPLTRIADGKTW